MWTFPHRPGSSAVPHNPNGAQGGAAAVANDAGNVVGVMPHPERASEEVLGSEDGMILLRSFLDAGLLPAGHSSGSGDTSPAPSEN